MLRRGRAAWGTPASAAGCGARGTARPREEQQEAMPLSAWVARAAAASASPPPQSPPEKQGEQAAGVGWGWMEKNGGREFRPRGGRDGAAQAEAFALGSRARGGRAAAGGRPPLFPAMPGPTRPPPPQEL